MTFHEVLFPVRIAFGSSGGPSRRTDVVSLANGDEERNAVWADSRRSYDAGQGVKSLDDVDKITQFFEARYGRLYGFRYKDPLDNKSCLPSGVPQATDQAIGTGTGSLSTFQLVKLYVSGGYTYSRTIKKPCVGSVLVALDGVPTTAFTVDTTTGIVTMDSPPSAAVAVTAGFQFDVPVRFDTDDLAMNVEKFMSGQVPSIPLIEIKR